MKHISDRKAIVLILMAFLIGCSMGYLLGYDIGWEKALYVVSSIQDAAIIK